VQPHLAFDDLRGRARDLMVREAVRTRLLLIPVPILIASTVIVFDDALWRRIVLGIAIAGLLGVSVVEAVRIRRGGRIGDDTVSLNLTFAVLGHAVIALASGGLWSPTVVASPLLTLLLALIVSPRTAKLLFVVELLVVWLGAIMVALGGPAVVPTLFRWGSPSVGFGLAHVVAAGLLLTILDVLAYRAGASLMRVLSAQVREALEARDASLRVHQERAGELTQLSAEIAHELKNPLASVKGLSALLAKNAEGRDAELLGVLRREVDRMQSVLDDFLNFSRPLVPLSLEQVDVGALAETVRELHEGVAVERGVRVRVEASAGIVARCDARKVQQVLINLVQNALDASPRGTEVRVEIEAVGGSVRVRVLDEGAGLAPEVAARVFEPGVTTKTRGSGLGLTIARGLARQHGGELSLGAREGGGATAELTVPLEGPEPGQGVPA
jgi:signal transduction histidine kinase